MPSVEVQGILDRLTSFCKKSLRTFCNDTGLGVQKNQNVLPTLGGIQGPAAPDRQLGLAVFPARPQPQAPAGSVPRRRSTATSVGSVPHRTSTASFGWPCSPTATSAWQCSPPDLNRELRLAVFPTGPQPRVSLGSVPRQTSRRLPLGSVARRASTASFGWQCSPPDLNREFRLAAFPAGPQMPALCRLLCVLVASFHKQLFLNRLGTQETSHSKYVHAMCEPRQAAYVSVGNCS